MQGFQRLRGLQSQAVWAMGINFSVKRWEGCTSKGPKDGPELHPGLAFKYNADKPKPRQRIRPSVGRFLRVLHNNVIPSAITQDQSPSSKTLYRTPDGCEQTKSQLQYMSGDLPAGFLQTAAAQRSYPMFRFLRLTKDMPHSGLNATPA